jgi:DNA-binding transcriptional MocR family regulator
MGVFDVPYCPDQECDQERLKEGQKCPKCGTLAQKFGINDATQLMQRKKLQIKIKEGAKEILVSEEMTDEDIQKRIYDDMMNLAMHEAGTGWMRLGTLLSGNSTDQMLGAGFKALVDQNKIIIRQNELILRNLKRSAER